MEDEDHIPPVPQTIARDSDNAAVQLKFSEAIMRGEGAVTAKYYKEWDIFNPVAVSVEDITIQVSENAATFAATNIPAGAYLCFSYEAGAFTDQKGNPCNALNSGLNMNTGKFTGAYVHVTNKPFDIQDAFVIAPKNGSIVTNVANFKGEISFPFDIYRNDANAKLGDLAVTFTSASRKDTYNLDAADWSVKDSVLTFTIPKAANPEVGDIITFSIVEGAIADVYGNLNNKFTSNIAWKYFVPTLDMILGIFEIGIVSYWSEDGSAKSMGTITISEIADKENGLIIKGSFGLFEEDVVIEGSYDLSTGKIYIPNSQVLSKYTNNKGTTYGLKFATTDSTDAAAFTINEDGILTADGMWGLCAFDETFETKLGWIEVAKMTQLTTNAIIPEHTIEWIITPDPSVPHKKLNSVTLMFGCARWVTLADKSKVLLTDSEGNALKIDSISGSNNVYTITFNELTPGVYTFKTVQGAFTYQFGDKSPVDEIMATYTITPPSIYSITITSTGNGSAAYNETEIRRGTSVFTIVEGSNAIITFTPDTGYKVKSVKLNNSDVTSEIMYNKYTIGFIDSDNTVEVEFEKIAENEGQSLAFIIGNWNALGYDYYSGGAEEEWTATFEKDPIGLNKVWIYNICSGGCSSSYAVYGIFNEDKTEIHIPVGQSTAATSSYGVFLEGFRDEGKTKIENGDYIVGKINEDGTITFEDWFGTHAYQSGTTTSAGWYSLKTGAIFKKQSPTNYTLTIKSTGNGSAGYNGTIIRNGTPSFTVFIGSPITISFTPDNGYRIKNVMVNGAIVASDVSSYQYMVSNISGNTTVEVEFMEELMAFTSNGVNYVVTSYDGKTVTVGSGNYGKVLEVPANVSYQEKTWTVTGIDNAVMAGHTELAAVIWNPATAFKASVSNPNFLLYVKSADYAPSTVKNVVVNGIAERITLTDATNGNDFYCPQEFTAKTVSYTHNYKMTTGIGTSRGWETIALPFDVQQVTHQNGSELVPFANWQRADATKPFWLMELGSSGWTEATAIKANTPYIISMPNNENYKPEFRVNGNVTFKAENVTVRKSDDMQSQNGNGKTFVPNFTNQESANYYALNVSNDYVTYSGGAAEGSRFVAGLRPVRPFEAYMTSEAGVREIAIADDLATGIAQAIVLIGGRGDTKVYDLKGRVVADGAGCSQEELRRMLPYGVYIFNGRKLIVK